MFLSHFWVGLENLPHDIFHCHQTLPYLWKHFLVPICVCGNAEWGKRIVTLQCNGKGGFVCWLEDHSADRSISFSVRINWHKKWALLHSNSKQKSFWSLWVWSNRDISLYFEKLPTKMNVCQLSLQALNYSNQSLWQRPAWAMELLNIATGASAWQCGVGWVKILQNQEKQLRPSPNKIFAIWRKSLEWAEIWANISVSHFQPTVSRGWKQANDWYCALCHQPSIYGKENSSVRFVGGCQGRY